mmetsp:Transcript_23962/g.24201  ORF Transcript_23962/g.24201 Transcript_23962/m.24201 type:complete len:789 (+) Transcript_23962:130-2496(+)|eukprot:CAMPEP_0182421328 /NCGR_PEP_ID=MMETSP1167-20130531/6665_1 /TAXON_ID=2988 /ORGANISM="Mallomonas Sp, Strain CCMP3275" /LENGTH=788 /DNA_ID=CAMNT_0024598351 /DNA_START=130 /DNA_END=2496 /DNA_ORIENTATION=-
MASKQKGNKSFGDGPVQGASSDTQDYEDLIRRLKLLSKTQSTFLKLYLQGKLSTAASIVSRALVKVRHLKKEDSSLLELEAALANLKLEELDVDYTNAEIMLRDELATLSNAVNQSNGTPLPPPAAPSASSHSSSADKSSLEAENANLRSLLAEAKADILAKEKVLSGLANSPVNPPAPPGPAAPGGETTSNDAALQAEIKTLNARLAEKDSLLQKKETELSDKISVIAIKEDEVKTLAKKNADLNAAAASGAAGATTEAQRLRGEISDLQAALEKTKAEAKASLEKQGSELRATADKRVKDLETKMEAEKEEMMDAMAQEVEAVEKKYNEEGSQKEKENIKLRESLSKMSGTNSKMTSGLRGLKKKMAEIKRQHKTLKTDTKTQVQDLKGALKDHMGRSIITSLKEHDKKMEEIKKKYKKEMNDRKKLHNQIQELKGNIRVYMRCRPPSDKEIEMHGADSQCVTFLDGNEVKLLSEKGREKIWEFDEVFNLQSTQEQVYPEVAPLVQSVLDGYNVCIFAYGQTGSGKTFTMNGPPNNRGVNTRALDDLFNKSQARNDEWNDSIMVSILEVYNETIRDLLVTGGGDDKLEIRQSEHGNVVTNLTTVPVFSLADVEQLMATADRNRSQACTNMNEHSSRSHMMLQVTVVCENLLSNQQYRGKLNLVDLAGSERIDKSGATGVALKEAQNINKSLSALGDVIQARASKQGHIPFRNSTLTYLLQDSLSQDSKTLMFVCISPILYNAEESFCSLNFAARVRTVELGKANKKVLPKSESSGGLVKPTSMKKK